MNILVLWERQKPIVCEFYSCSDSHDNQYPKCKGFINKECKLQSTQKLLNCINEMEAK